MKVSKLKEPKQTVEKGKTGKLPKLNQKIKTTMYFEIQGNKKEDVKKAMQNQLNELEKKAELKDHRTEDIVEVEPDQTEQEMESQFNEEQMYSISSETTINSTLSQLIEIAIRYTPSMVEIESPNNFNLSSKELLSMFGKISNLLTKMTEELGPIVELPDFEIEERPTEDLDDMKILDLVEDGNIWFRMVTEAYGKNQEQVVDRVLQYLNIHGTKITNYKIQNNDPEKFEGQIAIEGLSRFENLFVLNSEFLPTALSIIEPDEKTIKARELQNALTDLAGISFELTHRQIFKQKTKTQQKPEQK